jgi:hypothetical protein
MAALAEGLRLLNRADPFVEVGLGGAALECTKRTRFKDQNGRARRLHLSSSSPLFGAARAA